MGSEVAAEAAAIEPAELRGRTVPWGRAAAFLLAALVVVGLWLRLRGLAAEGFADDEVHKWLAANRYLAGDFGGDDVEHPMLMKSLVALSLAALRGVLAPEALTRLPSALGGGLSVWATAMLGRRLFGRGAALVSAALLALSTTAVGYHRVGKEDMLLGLFFILCLWCFCEAKAAAEDGRRRDQGRWELGSAAALGAAFASKYFIFYFPIPVLAYLWVRPGSAWRVPFRRWVALVGVALAAFLALNFTPLIPSTYAYLGSYIRGDVMGTDRGVSESLVFMGRLYGNLAVRGDATPWWFYLAFAGAKFAPLTAVLMAAGLAIALVLRAPAHRVVLVWIAIFHGFALIAGAKYGRFFVSAMPAFLLVAGDAAARLARVAARLAGRIAWNTPSPRVALSAVALVAAAAEARAAVSHAPHHRLYLNAFAGGDRRVTWFLPHCDYFDAGVREAVAWVAAHAETGAEVASEVDWTVRLYAEWAGRPDLVSSPILPGRGCRTGRPCYVLAQPGRVYRHNQAALGRLSLRRPVHVERIRGEDAARVYRLDPGEPLFPPGAPVAERLIEW